MPWSIQNCYELVVYELGQLLALREQRWIAVSGIERQRPNLGLVLTVSPRAG